MNKREIWILIMDGKPIPAEQGGGFMAQVLTNVRAFPQPEAIPKLDEFLLKIGAKEMVTPKKETDGATAIKWNQSVLGLIGTLIVILSVLVGFVWNYAVLSTKFDTLQKEGEKQATYEKSEREKLEIRVKSIEDIQRTQEKSEDRLTGYKIAKAEKGDK